MKTTLLLIGAILATNFAMAQSPTKFGVKAGVNFQNITGKAIDGEKVKNDIKTGFVIGVDADIPVGIDFYVQPGVLFSTKGTSLDDADAKVNLSYLEVPVNFLYKPSLGTGKMLLGFGPYVAYALGGKMNPESGSSKSLKFENKVTAAEYTAALTNGTAYAKRFDAGANFFAGYEFSNRLSFQLNAQLGLLNINPKISDYPDDKSALKNTGFGITAGYKF